MTVPSIQRFTRLFLASLAVAAALAAATFRDLKRALIQQDPAMGSLGDGVLVLSIALGLGAMLLLWFLIARRASNLAKWVLVALTALSIALQLPKLGPIVAQLDAVAVLSLLAAATQLYAIAQLFRADAVAWLTREGPGEPVDLG